MSLLDEMKNHEDVRVKETLPGVFACNFTRAAFYGNRWDSLTTAARGLFLDKDGNVLARGYEKFFGIDEYNGVTLDEYMAKVAYPVIAKNKENGYLGILAVIDDELVMFSKSGVTDYSRHAQMMLNTITNETDRDMIKSVLKSENASLLIEVVDAIADPHIILEDGWHLCLLNLVKNSEKFEILPMPVEFEELEKLTEGSIRIPRMTVIENEEELRQFLKENESSLISEGAVLTDANAYMVKAKSQFYRDGKNLRTHLGRVFRGKSDAEGEAVVKFLESKNYKLDDFVVTSIVDTRILDMASLLDVLIENGYKM